MKSTSSCWGILHKNQEEPIMMILGTDYYLDQDFTDSDRKSLLKNEDSDILFEYELSHEVSGDEALCELWLRWQNLFRYKPSELK